MPRKRPRFIIRAQIGFHTPLGKEQNKTKQKKKKQTNKQIQRQIQKQKQKQKQGVFLDEK